MFTPGKEIPAVAGYTAPRGNYASMQTDGWELGVGWRDSREFVMDKILEDLNFATTYCLSDKAYVNNSQINRWVALAFKARVCLYEGTYRKYHTEFGLGASSDKWLRESVSACETLMNESPYSLVHSSANLKTQWRKLFTSGDIDYQEIIFANEFSEELLRFHSATWKFTSGSYGSRWSLSKAFVNTYLMLTVLVSQIAVTTIRRSLQKRFRIEITV